VLNVFQWGWRILWITRSKKNPLIGTSRLRKTIIAERDSSLRFQAKRRLNLLETQTDLQIVIRSRKYIYVFLTQSLIDQILTYKTCCSIYLGSDYFGTREMANSGPYPVRRESTDRQSILPFFNDSYISRAVHLGRGSHLKASDQEVSLSQIRRTAV
jgi:hypothetical protein